MNRAERREAAKRFPKEARKEIARALKFQSDPEPELDALEKAGFTVVEAPRLWTPSQA